jgi:hypothetical protein
MPLKRGPNVLANRSTGWVTNSFGIPWIRFRLQPVKGSRSSGWKVLDVQTTETCPF